MVVIAIGAVLLAVALPNLSDLIIRNRAITQTNEVIGTINVARSEAATRGLRVTVCALAAAGGNQCAAAATPVLWERGWVVFIDNTGTVGSIDTDDVLLRVYPALEGGTTLRSNVAAISYQPNGFLESAATTLNLRVSHCTNNEHRDIAVSAIGRPSITNASC